MVQIIGSISCTLFIRITLLCSNYINDLGDDIASKVLQFSDDTNVFRTTKIDANRQHLQDDLNKLIEWSEKWQMLFNCPHWT